MKQVLQNLRTGKTSVVDVPVPNPQPGTALVHTAASLVSAGTERMVVEFAEKSLLGKARSRPDLVRQLLDKARRDGLLTTLEDAFNRLDQPLKLGYSSAGTVVTIGEGLSGIQVGQRVACAGGGYAVHAEYAVVPQNMLTSLPDKVDFESAAFATLGAIALHGFRLAEVQVGERVAVIGLGLLGLLAVGIASAAGCPVLGVDLNPDRVKLAHNLGAEAVLREQAEEAAKSISRGRGCDTILICADTATSEPVELAGAIARDRARVVAVGAVGLHIPRKVYYEKELNLIVSRSYGPGRYDPAYEEAGQDYPIGYVRWTEGRNLEAFVDLLASGRLDVHSLISHRIPIEHAPEAYALITGKRAEPFLGILLTYSEPPPTKAPSQTETGTVIFIEEKADQPAPPDRVSLGVLGAGNFANAVLLPVLSKLPDLDLVGVASASGVSAQHTARHFGFHYATADEAQIIRDPAINTVAVLTRHHLHARQVQAALQAGKHVFCEKPLALTSEELDQINAATQQPSAHRSPLSPHTYPLLMVGFNRRFAPLAQRLYEFLEGQTEPFVAHYRVNAGYLPPNHWLHDLAQGGGRIVGEACHFVDFLTFLAGAPPISVTARALPDAERYREDNAVLTFTFPKGSLGTVSYLANGDKSLPKERIEVFCSGRMAVLDDFRSLVMARDGRRKSFRSRLRQDKGHQAEWKAFTDAILSGGPPPIPYDHLFGVTRATFDALQALRNGETVCIQPFS